jgi:hypothetical protein
MIGWAITRNKERILLTRRKKCNNCLSRLPRKSLNENLKRKKKKGRKIKAKTYLKKRRTKKN